MVAVRLSGDRIGNALAHFDVEFKLMMIVSTHTLSVLTNFQVSFFDSYPVHIDLLNCSSLILLLLASNFFKLLWILILIPLSIFNWSNHIISFFNRSGILFNLVDILIHILKHVKVSINRSIRFNIGKFKVFISLRLVRLWNSRHFNICLFIHLIIFQVFSTATDAHSSFRIKLILSNLLRLEFVILFLS